MFTARRACSEISFRDQQGEERKLQLAAMKAAAVVIRAESVFAEHTGGAKAGFGAVLPSWLGVLTGGNVTIEGGWLDTPQAKPMLAALVDAWNQLLRRLAAVKEPPADTRLGK